MYEDMLKEKENLGIKLVHGEEEKKKLTKENELLAKKIAENGRVCMITLLSCIILFMLKSLTCMNEPVETGNILNHHDLSQKVSWVP